MNTSNQTITLSSNIPFGCIQYWPACEKSEILCKLLDRKTINTRHIEDLKKLGFEIKFKNQSYGGRS